jgi:hypothetical protein
MFDFIKESGVIRKGLIAASAIATLYLISTSNNESVDTEFNDEIFTRNIASKDQQLIAKKKSTTNKNLRKRKKLKKKEERKSKSVYQTDLNTARRVEDYFAPLQKENDFPSTSRNQDPFDDNFKQATSQGDIEDDGQKEDIEDSEDQKKKSEDTFSALEERNTPSNQETSDFTQISETIPNDNSSGSGGSSPLTCFEVIEFNGHEQYYVTTNDIRLSFTTGDCTDDETINVDINNEASIISISENASELVANSGETVAYCDENNKIIVLYAIVDPDKIQNYEFAIYPTCSTPADGFTKVIAYERPQIPNVDMPADLADDAIRDTNDTTPTISGACHKSVVDGIEYRIKPSTTWLTSEFTDIDCSNENWSWTAPAGFTGNPETTYEVEFRTFNDEITGVAKYSQISTVGLAIDTVAPINGPVISGLTGSSANGTDSTVDTWIGPGFPTVVAQTDADAGEYESTIFAIDGTTIICGPKKGTTPIIEFEAADCGLSFVDNTQYLARVWIYDSAGNISDNYSEVTITADLAAPVVNFTSTPTDNIPLSDISIAFTYVDGDSGLDSAECRVDGGALSDCPGAGNFNNLTPGSHTIDVVVVDSAGNISTTSYTWTVTADLILPTCSSIAPDLALTNNGSPNFTFSCSDNDAVLDVLCSLNNGTYASCDSVTAQAITGLGDGAHTIKIKGMDRAGNYSAESSEAWVQDISAPTITFTARPDNFENNQSATFEFSVSDDSNITSLQCSLNSVGFSDCTSPYILAGPLPEGSYDLEVTATDLAGNIIAASTYVEAWLIDITAPNPPSFTSATNTASETPLIEWVSGGNAGNGMYRLKFDDADMTAGTTSVTGVNYTPGTALSLGAHLVYLQERDNSENWSAIATQNINVQCAIGKFNSSGVCSVCVAGEYQGVAGILTSCSSCAVGTYQDQTGQGTCKIPATGFYQNQTAQIIQIACPANQTTVSIANASDHDNISDCTGASGYYNCATSCTQTTAGYYSPNADDTQSQCQAGYYCSSAGESSATGDGACAAGRYCPAGSTSDQGSGVCNANTYSTSGATSASCSACPTNSIITGTNTADHDALIDCKGDTDYYACADGTCDAVGIGYYSAAEDDTRTICTNMPANAASVTYSSDGNGVNNCTLASADTCDVNWIPNGVVCDAQDTTPNAFTYTDVVDQALSSVITSNSINIGGINSPAAVTISGSGSPQFRIAAGSWVTSGTITNGQSLQLRLTSSGSVNTMLSATVDVAGVTDQWDVTTILPPPVNTVVPLISGITQVGETLTCSTGTWENVPTGHTYQWKRGAGDISGATNSTYVFAEADNEQNISCDVVASNSSGASSAVSSVAVVNTKVTESLTTSGSVAIPAGVKEVYLTGRGGNGSPYVAEYYSHFWLPSSWNSIGSGLACYDDYSHICTAANYTELAIIVADCFNYYNGNLEQQSVCAKQAHGPYPQTTGTNTTSSLDGNNFTYNGGVGGSASSSSQNVILDGLSAKTLSYTIGTPGGSLVYTYYLSAE